MSNDGPLRALVSRHRAYRIASAPREVASFALLGSARVQLNRKAAPTAPAELKPPITPISTTRYAPQTAGLHCPLRVPTNNCCRGRDSQQSRSVAGGKDRDLSMTKPRTIISRPTGQSRHQSLRPKAGSAFVRARSGFFHAYGDDHRADHSGNPDHRGPSRVTDN
jgi:hypothetical protein